MTRKILIIDSEADFADMCRSTLGNIGYNVFCAHTGEQAVELSEQIHFDLAIVNGMPFGVNGIDTFTVLRQNEPGLIGILVTGQTELSTVLHAMKAGFSGVLEKPVDSAQLIHVVEEGLSVALLREENTRLKTLLPLYQLGKKFISAVSEVEVYTELVEAIHQEIQVPCVSVMIYDKQDHTLKIAASVGISEHVIKHAQVRAGEKIAGWVFSHKKPVILNRRTQDSTMFSEYLDRDDITASISYPLIVRGFVKGVVNISQKNPEIEYSRSDIEMLSVICSQAVMALDNVLSMQERERALKLRTLFEQYVAPEVAEFLISRKSDMLEVGEVRDLTVMFADIRNFTTLVQHISPEQLRIFLNQFFEMFVDIVFAEKGTLDKFMGDAALVLFGAPVPHGQPEISAVHAAQEILRSFGKLKRTWCESSSWFEKIDIGIGISRGEVYLGNVGSERRLDFTVIGTNVNIAQRLATENNNGQILVTENIQRTVSGVVPVKKEGSRQLRGLEYPLTVYSVQLH